MHKYSMYSFSKELNTQLPWFSLIMHDTVVIHIAFKEAITHSYNNVLSTLHVRDVYSVSRIHSDGHL